LNTFVNAQANDSVIRAHVAAATYTDEDLLYTSVTPTGIDLSITFEPGTVIPWTQGTDKSCVDAGDDITLRLFGSGLRITGFNAGTGNGLGASATGSLYAYDITVDDCVDGVSSHDSAYLECHRVTVSDCDKGPWTCISSVTCKAFDSSFTGKSGQTGNTISSVAGDEFTNCEIIPPGNNDRLVTNGSIFTNCRVGSLTNSCQIDGMAATLNDCFVNLYLDGNATVGLTECYGTLSSRQRSGGAITVTRCVLVGPPAASAVDSLRYFTADLGSGNFDVIDSVITGYATGIGGGFNATAGTHWTTATNAATFCNFFNNTTDVDSNITTGVSETSLRIQRLVL
jgi:hypothetical protein